jgi:hypothetical protein
MRTDTIHSGQLNRRVELFKYEKQASDVSERVRVETSLGKVWVNRIEVYGNEEEEGKLIPLSVCRFQMRYNLDILKNGTGYFLRDLDGDYQINSVAITGAVRNSYMELKCSRRG